LAGLSLTYSPASFGMSTGGTTQALPIHFQPSLGVVVVASTTLCSVIAFPEFPALRAQRPRPLRRPDVSAAGALPQLLAVHADQRRARPVLVGSDLEGRADDRLSDLKAPLAAAGCKRHRRDGDDERRVQRRAWCDAGWTAYLDLPGGAGGGPKDPQAQAIRTKSPPTRGWSKDVAGEESFLVRAPRLREVMPNKPRRPYERA